MTTRAVFLVTVLVSIGLTIAPAGISGGPPSHDEQAGTEPRAYIVAFDALPKDRARYHGAHVTAVDDELGLLVVETANPNGFERRVRSDDRVRYLEQDHRDWHLTLTPNDALYGDSGHYGTKITNTESAWDVSTGSTAVIVAMIDSGINRNHEDFETARVLQGYDYANGDNDPEDTGKACGYHGSHTSGTAGATLGNGVGIAGMSQHTILPLKIFHGDSGNPFWGCRAATTSAIAEAIKDAADAGAHVSSNSWGGGSSPTLNDAIDYAHNKGTIHVAAAGNSGSCTDCVNDPWASRPNEVVIVSCSDSDDNFCSFSSQGPEIDIIAPGDAILSVDGGTTSGYKKLSGTSMSTPHVAGAIGLYIAANGDASFSTIESALGSSADDIGLSSARQGDGRLNTGVLLGGGSGGDTNSPPTASFTYSCTDLTCDFDGSASSDSEGSISSYDWDFGDGNTGTGSTVSHTYASGATYTVTLTVTDGDGATDSSSQDVRVSDGPAGGIHVGDLDGSGTSGQGGDWTGAVTVTVHNASHAAEGGSSVSFDYTGSKGASGLTSCTTASDGTCSVSVSLHNRESPVTFTVTAISDSDGSYDASSNHDPDGDSDGTTITVSKS